MLDLYKLENLRKKLNEISEDCAMDASKLQELPVNKIVSTLRDMFTMIDALVDINKEIIDILREEL